MKLQPFTYPRMGILIALAFLALLVTAAKKPHKGGPVVQIFTERNTDAIYSGERQGIQSEATR